MRYRFYAGACLLGGIAAAGGAAKPVAADQATPHATGPLRSKTQDPRFVLLVSEASAPTKLRQKLTLEVQEWSLARALDEIARQLRLPLIYDSLVTGYRRPITVKREDMTGASALLRVLRKTGLGVEVAEDGSAARIRRVEESSSILGGDAVGVLVGRVTDALTKRSVGGAEVFLNGTSWRTVTDTNGRYQLSEIEAGSHTLVVRRLGYGKQTRNVVVHDGQKDTVDIALEPVVTRLDEVVTTATGRQRRRDIAHDITTINADSVMQAAPIRSVTDLLETRVPGLTVQHTSGAPGDPSRLRLRGAASALRSNDPIVIVDGVRIYAEQSAERSANLAGDYAAPSPVDYIDPNSIETIEVVKGPSAATLYGQDAANGVIVITTKKGKAGPPRWNMSAEHGRTQLAGDYPELFFRWGHEFFHGASVNCPISNQTYLLTRDVIVPCEGDSLRTFQLLNDPATTVLDRGHRTSLSLGVSGGTQTLTYAVTTRYSDEIGLINLPAYEVDRYQASLGLAVPAWMRRPQHHKQWGATSTLAARLGTKADLTLTTSFSRIEQQRSSLEKQLGRLMSVYLDKASGIYYESGALFGNTVGITSLTTAINSYYQRATATANQFRNGIAATWQPKTWLSIVADAGLNLDQRTDQAYVPRGPSASSVQGPDTTGSVGDGQGTSTVSTINLRANAVAPIGRSFQFRAAAGVNYAGTSINDVVVASKNLPIGTSLRGDSITQFGRREFSEATFGWYVEPSIGNSKFNFSSGLRLDGGKSFGGGVSGFQLPKFPKLGLSYLLSDEPFFPFKNVFQSFRVRVAYGRASRQPGPTDRLRLYGSPRGMLADSIFQSGTTLQTLGNTEIRPERTAEIEGGFDADLLDNRLTIEVTGYRKTTDDALLNIPVAPSVYGLGENIIKNIGVIRNTGFDLTTTAQLVRSGPVTWTTRLQLSKRRDLVVKLAPGMTPYYSMPNNSFGDAGLRVAPGYPLNGRWSRPILGYADANGNGVLEVNEIQLGDTAVFVGATLPDRALVLGTTLSLWRGTVTLDATVQHEGGLSQRNEVAQQLWLFSAGTQDPSASLDQQMAAANVYISTGSGSDYNWIQTVSSTRLTSLAVNYRMPPAVARRLGAQQLNIALQGGNLGLWTNYRGIDPHVNAFSTGNGVTDTGVLPLPRTWQVRVNATY